MHARPATILIAAAAVVATAAGCSSSTGGSGETAHVSPPSSVTPVTSAAPLTSSAPVTSSSPVISATPTSSAPAAAAGTPITVGKSFSDSAIGESGTVLKYLRNFQVSAATKTKYSALQDEEVVLVEVTVNSSKKYYDSLGEDSFFLIGNDGQQNAENDTIVGPSMAAAGYRVLKDATNGASQTGWIAFPIDKGFTKLTLQYYTLAATTSNGKTIPAKKVNIKLV